MLANGRFCVRANRPSSASVRSQAHCSDAGGVATKTTQSGDTPIPIDEHQPFAASVGTAGNRHDKTGNDLAAALDRMGDPCHGAWFHQAAASKAQLQTVQIEFQARWLSMAAMASRAWPGGPYHVPSLFARSRQPHR